MKLGTGLLVLASCGCAQGPALSAPPSPVRAVPLTLCRSASAMGDPCFPTPSEIGSRTIDPCYSRRAGRCGGAGQGMCYLFPITEGRRCSSGEGTCSGGRCTPN